MEGNYTRCIAQRLARATGFIVLDVSTATSLFRYLRRTWFERNRHGALAGSMDSVKWQMIRHITVVTPPNRRKYVEMFEGVRLPKIRLATTGELKRFYRAERLSG
jgi:adenylate kinase family enzyme